MPSCKILDSREQSIIQKSDGKPDDVAIFQTHDWEVTVSSSMVKDIDSPILSPYAFLYFQYTASKKERQLWVFIANKYVFLTIFHDGKPFVNDVCEKESIVACIEGFLRRYYENEGSDFIEGVMLYSLEPVKEDLEEKLLLPIDVRQVEPAAICKEKELLYRPKTKPNYLLIGSLVLLFLLLVGFDLYVKYTLYQKKDRIKRLLDKEIEFVNQKNDYDSQLMKLAIIKPTVSDLLSHNELLMQKLHSIFDLVPDDAYLTKFTIARNELFIEGVARNREEIEETLYKELSSFYPHHKIVIKRVKEGYLFKMAFRE